MDPSITAAIISAVATILAAIIVPIPIKVVLSWLFRKRQNIPQIMGTVWKADWYTETGELYVSDKIEFKKWTRNNKFKGSGEMMTGIEPDENPRRYVYPIEGEVAPNRTVILVYRAENFPTQSLIGTASLRLGESARDLIGYWVGPRKFLNSEGEKDWKLISGKVKMKKTQ
jgi:hypothetical protein